ncbi:MAG: type II secretion system inner membrane protein GspF [Deltaproteobacteria bacterium]|nr:type II secretion system inner membrane protein GspF [Deltaproteobacteria bacterium]
MPVFRYQGIDQKGKKTTGSVDAENERAARAKLRKGNVFPTAVVESGGTGATLLVSGEREFKFQALFHRIKPQDISLMTRQMSSLLNAGVPLVDTLTAMVDQLEQPKLRTAISEIRERVTEGEKFSSAMGEHPQIFNELYINMVSAGEASGTLEKVLERIADITEAQARLRAKIVGALTYPIIMGIVGVIMMILLITFVIPKMTAMLIEMEIPLPTPTRFLIWLTDQILGWWWILLLGLVIAITAFRRWINTVNGRTTFDRWMLRLPLVGRLIRLAAVARLTRTLGTLLRGGVPMLTAMDIVRNIVSNVILKRVLEETRDAVKEGASLAEPLKRSGHFPPLATHMIAIGEKTGELEGMLERIAETYETQVDNAVGSMMSLLEPITLVVMGGMVAFIVRGHHPRRERCCAVKKASA